MINQKGMILATITATILVFATSPMTYAVIEDEGEFVPNKPNPYCDKVSDEYMRNGGTCHDRYDYEDGDFASCNDGSQREDPEDCPDATEENDD